MQTVWYYPNEVYVDKELLAKSRFVKADGDFGKAAPVQFFACKLCMRLWSACICF